MPWHFWRPLNAPDHWLAEAVNALWPKVSKGDLNQAEAKERLDALLRAPVIGTPRAGLIRRALAISVSNSVTVYDALYVALSEKRHIQMVTDDRRLIRQLAGDAALSRHIIWLGDIPAHS